jgi:hypothetical protein
VLIGKVEKTEKIKITQRRGGGREFTEQSRGWLESQRYREE